LASQPAYALAVSLVAIWILTAVNSAGVREAGYVQVVTTVLKLLPLLLIIAAGLFYIRLDHFQPFNISESGNLSAITATATLTLFAFMGLECATIPAASTADPEKTIPRATILGTLVTTAV